MRITRAQTTITIGNVEWTDEAWEIHIRHPSITMSDMVDKAVCSGKLKFWEEWEPEYGYAHMFSPTDDVRVCITDGEIIMTGGYTKEGEDRLDGTTYPTELPLSDFLVVAQVSRILLH